MSTLAAVTAMTGQSYPPYINVSVDADTGKVIVHVRGDPVKGATGPYVKATFSPLEWSDFVRQVSQNG